MPAGVTGIVRMRETHGEGPKPISWQPSPTPDQLIESSVQNGHISDGTEWLTAIAWQPHDRKSPTCRIVLATWNIAPHDGAGFGSLFL